MLLRFVVCDHLNKICDRVVANSRVGCQRSVECVGVLFLPLCTSGVAQFLSILFAPLLFCQEVSQGRLVLVEDVCANRVLVRHERVRHSRQGSGLHLVVFSRRFDRGACVLPTQRDPRVPVARVVLWVAYLLSCDIMDPSLTVARQSLIGATGMHSPDTKVKLTASGYF